MSLLDIHAVINYEKLAPILGFEPTSKLSNFLRCPYCSSYTWSIYQDNCSLEQWHRCANCKKTGTLLAMAADQLGLTETEVISHVSQHYDYSFKEEDLNLFVKAEAKSRSFYTLWERASNSLPEMSKEHLGLLTGLNWNYFRHLDTERIKEGPGKLLGVSNSTALDVFLKLRGFSKSQPVIVVPYFSSFQRIKGFQVITPRFNQFKECLISSQRVSKLDEGLAGLLLLDKFESDTVLMTSMLDNMVQLQMKNFQSNVLPLPILSWKLPYKPTQRPHWEILAGKKLCFWERKPTAAILYHAMYNNGYCSFMGPYKDKNSIRSEQWIDWLNHRPAISIYQCLLRNMVPVDKAIKTWLEYASREEKTRLLLDAEQFDSSVLKLVQSKLNSKSYVIPAKKVTTSLINTNNPLSSKGSVTIIEREGKWFDNTGALRFGAIMRIEYLVAYPNGDKNYVGYVQHKETKYPFTVKVEEAKLLWLKKFLADNAIHSLADPIDIYSSRNFSPFEVALRLHEPEVVQGVDRIGWDGQGFQFKNCRLIAGEATEIPEFKVVANAPGPIRTEYRLRTEMTDRIQDDSDEMTLCWALSLGLCAQLTAPAVAIPTYGIILLRSQHDIFLNTLMSRFAIKASETKHWKHNWPRFFNDARQAFRQDTNGFFVSYGTDGYLVRNKQLIAIKASNPALQPRFIPSSGEKIVMQYLKQFTADKHFRPECWQHWLDYTIVKMKTYFDFVDPKLIDNAVKLVRLV